MNWPRHAVQPHTEALHVPGSNIDGQLDPFINYASEKILYQRVGRPAAIPYARLEAYHVSDHQRQRLWQAANDRQSRFLVVLTISSGLKSIHLTYQFNWNARAGPKI